ncbi:MAG: hypothetical protein L7G97_05640 [Acidilobus sp.]|nr:hypothetical protein [Acidilobus sp.]
MDAPLEEGTLTRLDKRKKWQDAVIMTIYVPLDLKKELEERAAAKRKSLSGYVVSLIQKGLEVEKGMEVMQDAEAKKVS